MPIKYKTFKTTGPGHCPLQIPPGVQSSPLLFFIRSKIVTRTFLNGLVPLAGIYDNYVPLPLL